MRAGQTTVMIKRMMVRGQVNNSNDQENGGENWADNSNDQENDGDD